MLVAIVILAVGFGLANGLHDAGNAIAAPVVTRALRPGQAIALAATFHVIGALVIGTAVATTVAGIVAVPHADTLLVLGSAALGALAWNLFTLALGLPCSSGHCLVGALSGAALADHGATAVHWGGMQGLRPVGVVGSLVWLGLSSAVAVPLALAGIRVARRSLRGAGRSLLTPVRRGEIVTTAALALAHGSNDAQKTMGLLALALFTTGHLAHLGVPFWVRLTGAGAITIGTTLGGWSVVRTLGRGIFPLRALDGLVSQGTASLIVLAGSLFGAPLSTTDVVAPAVVGVGAGERWRHVRWRVVRAIGIAWLVTLPVSGGLGALTLVAWRALR